MCYCRLFCVRGVSAGCYTEPPGVVPRSSRGCAPSLTPVRVFDFTSVPPAVDLTIRLMDLFSAPRDGDRSLSLPTVVWKATGSQPAVWHKVCRAKCDSFLPPMFLANSPARWFYAFLSVGFSNWEGCVC